MHLEGKKPGHHPPKVSISWMKTADTKRVRSRHKEEIEANIRETQRIRSGHKEKTRRQER